MSNSMSNSYAVKYFRKGSYELSTFNQLAKEILVLLPNSLDDFSSSIGTTPGRLITWATGVLESEPKR